MKRITKTNNFKISYGRRTPRWKIHLAITSQRFAQFARNFVRRCKIRPQWQSDFWNFKFPKFMMADGFQGRI